MSDQLKLAFFATDIVKEHGGSMTRMKLISAMFVRVQGRVTVRDIEGAIGLLEVSGVVRIDSGREPSLDTLVLLDLGGAQ